MSSRIACWIAALIVVACSAEDGGVGGTSGGTTMTQPGSESTRGVESSGASTTADTTGSSSGSSGTSALGTSGTLEGTTGSEGGSSGVDGCADGERNGDETDVDCGGSCPACPIGSACGVPDDCAEGSCEAGSCLGPAATCDLGEVMGTPGGDGWKDSYSVDGKCYCDSTFDHDVGAIEVMTPAGIRTVLEVCEAIGPGPGAQGNPIYNDIQCGNGPPNDAGDEDWCPGRVDQGEAGCCTIGPTWDLSVFE